MLDVFLSLKPTPKQRPRFSKNGICYTAITTRKAENDIKILVKNEINKKGIDLTYEPIQIYLGFFFLSKTGMHSYNPKKPDLDNLIKLTLDSMNKIVYWDDCQIVKLVSEKFLSDKEGIHIKIDIIGKDNERI